MTGEWRRFTRGPHSPAAVALADQWQAEAMEIARAMVADQLAENDLEVDQDEMDLLEAGAAVGYAAVLVVLATNGWLSAPEATS